MYLWAKAAHVVAIVVWMSGMFSMAHRLSSEGSSPDDLPRLRDIDTSWTVAAMSLAFLLGFWMASQARWWIHPWFMAKFILVVGMAGLHGSLAAGLRRLEEQPKRPQPRWHRFAPSLLMVGLTAIAVLVVVKPA